MAEWIVLSEVDITVAHTVFSLQQYQAASVELDQGIDNGMLGIP